MISQISDLSLLSSSVIAVPPLCRNKDFDIDVNENRKLISHLEKGGVRVLLYGVMLISIILQYQNILTFSRFLLQSLEAKRLSYRQLVPFMEILLIRLTFLGV